MLKVDLEKKLINSKKKTIAILESEEKESNAILDQVKHIISDDYSDDIRLLKDFGFRSAIDNANDVLINNTRIINNSKNIKNKRIFTLKEIENIAIIYNLRFLESTRYIGALPPELPQKLKEFKELNLDQWYKHIDNGNYYILAPKNSFKLEVKPKDPLLFAKLKDGTYYLIHKWGDDLSVTRNIHVRAILISLMIAIPLMIGFSFIPGASLIWVISIISIISIIVVLIAIAIEKDERKSVYYNYYK